MQAEPSKDALGAATSHTPLLSISYYKLSTKMSSDPETNAAVTIEVTALYGYGWGGRYGAGSQSYQQSGGDRAQRL